MVHSIAECDDLFFARDVCDETRYARARGSNLLTLGPSRFHRLFGDVAQRDVASLFGELDCQLATHSGSATRDDCELIFERLHDIPF